MQTKPVTMFLFSVAALAMVLSPSLLQAETKVGVIDFQQALLDTAEMKKKAADLEAKFRPQQQELERLRQALQEIQKKLENATEAEQAALEFEGQQKQLELERKTQNLRDDVQFERDGILEEGARKMREVLAKLAVEKDLDLAIDTAVLRESVTGSPLYVKPAIDITREATIAYDKATAQDASSQ